MKRESARPEGSHEGESIWPPGEKAADPTKFVSFMEQQIAELKGQIDEAKRVPELPEGGDVGIRDMPEAVLDGRLGEIYQKCLGDFPRALAYIALVTVAAVLIRPGRGHLRSNLFTSIVGPAGCGKTQAIERSCAVLDVKPPLLEQVKSGSVEGLLAHLGDRKGESVLFFPDELAHLFEKAQIPHATFTYVLNTAFYRDVERLTIAHGKKVDFNCRLSIIGGLVDEKFEDSFGSATTGGLYDRFLFGQCPTAFQYLYRPFEAKPAFTDLLDECVVNRDVWDARDEFLKTENLSRRVVEIALRVGAICAAFDGRELRARDLGPTWELARYQTRIRCLLRPNTGKNFEAMLAHKMLAYLSRFDGKYVGRRQMLKAIRAYDLGPSIADRALNILVSNGDVKVAKVGKMELVGLVTSNEQTQQILESIGGENV